MPRPSSSHIAKPRNQIAKWLHGGLSAALSGSAGESGSDGQPLKPADQIRQVAALPSSRSVFLTVLVERSKSLSRDAAFSSALREVLGPRAENFSEALRDTLHEFFERGVAHGRQES